MNESGETVQLNQDWKNVSRQWSPYIEFGAQKGDSNERTVGKHVDGQDAYDLWHLAVRYKEVLACRQLMRNEKFSFEDIPRKHKFLIFFLLMVEYQEVEEIVELGCSVLELIDGLTLVQRYFRQEYNHYSDTEIKNHKFIGIDTSDLMCQAAIDIHPKNNVAVFKDTTAFLESIKSAKDVCRGIFDLNVSSYAFKSSLDLAAFLNEFEMGYIELALSKGETFISSQYHGAAFTYFSLEDLMSFLNKPLFFVCEKKTENKQWYINRLGKPVVNGFFVFGEVKNVKRFYTSAKKYSEIEQYFIEREIDLIEAAQILST